MNKTDLISQLEAYSPYDAQESRDRLEILGNLNRNDDILSRDNRQRHLTASAWVVNQDFSKILLAYHKIFRSFSWLGGHCDGDPDCLAVALREVKEESGLRNVRVLSPRIYALDILPVPKHLKNQIPIPAHHHLNLTYLLQAADNEPLQICEAENEVVQWFERTEYEQVIEEPLMLAVYRKLNKKIKEEAWQY